MRIAHLSDLHFGAHRPDLVAPLIADIAAFAPDAVAISGDLTQRAEAGEFAAARAFLATLPVPCLAVPGNHDIPRNPIERFTDPRGRWLRYLGQPTEGVIELSGGTVVGLDTVRRMQSHLDWSAGGIPPARLDRLLRRLAAARPPVAIVAHHPLRHPVWAAERALPHGAAEAIGALQQTGVAAILAGHLHRAAHIPGLPPILVEGSSLSHRVRGEPNGWSLVEFGAAGVTVRRRITHGLDWTDVAPAEFGFTPAA
jgi:3',5'-cyclic AMP phosphodiesterase CpdA